MRRWIKQLLQDYPKVKISSSKASWAGLGLVAKERLAVKEEIRCKVQPLQGGSSGRGGRGA